MAVWEDFSKYNQNWQQQVLGFDFWEEEKRLEERNRLEEEKRLEDQNASLPHFPLPQNDNEYLLECQYEFRHGDQESLVKMYKRLKTLSLKFINAIGQKNSHVRALSYEAKKIKAEDAATYLIEQYMKRADFAIVRNYPGYLFLRVLHELFYRREVDKLVDFVDLGRFFKEGQDDNKEELISQSESQSLLQEREIIHYTIKEEPESEEDQEQRELKQFYMWKKNRKTNGGKQNEELQF